MAFVLVFLLAWPVRALESRGLSRGAAAALAIFTLLVFIGLVFTFILPLLGAQLASLAVKAPAYLQKAQAEMDALQSTIRAVVLPAWAKQFLNSAFNQLATSIAALGQRVAASALSVGSQALTLLIDAVIALVITFWTLRDLPTIREEILVVSGRWRDDVVLLFDQIAKSMGGYLRGQTIASLSTGAIALVGLAIAGIPYAILLGALAFVLNYIPYVGPLVTGLIAALVGLFVSPLKALLAVVIVIAAQQITDNLITPRVMAAEVKLHPTLVIFSLLLGGTLFGVPGLLFAIPVAAAIQGAFVYYFERATQSQLATTEGALFKADTEPCDEEAGPCEDVEAVLPTKDGEPGK
jgi:predicted PurR-regulated permease PerM